MKSYIVIRTVQNQNIALFIIILDKSKPCDNLQLAFSVAETHLNIAAPDIITSEDGDLDKERVLEYLAKWEHQDSFYWQYL